MSNTSDNAFPVPYLIVTKKEGDLVDDGITWITHDDGCLLFTFILDFLITGSLCLFGFAGNAVSFVVFCMERSSECVNSVTYLLQAILIADTGVTWMIFLQDVVPAMAYVVPVLRNCVEVCQQVSRVTRPLLFLTQACVVWLTLAAATNRYIVTCKPGLATRICSLNFARKQVFGVLSAAIVFSFPLIVDTFIVLQRADPENGRVNNQLLVNNFMYERIYRNGFLFIVVFLLPLIAIACVCYKLVYILHSLKRLRRALEHMCKTETTELTQVMLTLSITLIICYIPSLIRSIVHWTTLPHQRHLCGHLTFYLDSFCHLFLALNSTMKVIIFCLFGHKFLERLKVTFCNCQKKAYHIELPTSIYKCVDMSEMTLISQVDNQTEQYNNQYVDSRHQKYMHFNQQLPRPLNG